MGKNSRVLCISDLHFPFEHPQTFSFLKAIKKDYSPNRVVLLGDEIDAHAMSFHQVDADLPSAGEELERALEKMKRLYEMFPQAIVIDSNHGSMALRKMKFHGIPLKYLAKMETVLEAPKGWRWLPDLMIPSVKKGMGVSPIYFCHGLMKDGLKMALSLGMNVVQGHFHNEFNIRYAALPGKQVWSMQVGCMIDDKSLAFAYNKTTLGRPMLGHGIILEGTPKLLPLSDF